MTRGIGVIDSLKLFKEKVISDSETRTNMLQNNIDASRNKIKLIEKEIEEYQINLLAEAEILKGYNNFDPYAVLKKWNEGV